MNASLKSPKPIKPLNPRSIDIKYTGSEPVWQQQPDAAVRQSSLVTAFSWYNYHYGKKDSKELVIDWLARNNKSTEAKAFVKVPENLMRNQLGWLCRMNLMGLTLSDTEQVWVDNTIAEFILAHKSAKTSTAEADLATSKITVQDRLRDRAIEIAGELDGMFDDMIATGAKMTADYKPITLLRGMNIGPQMLPIVTEQWKRRLDEFETVQTGKDSQLVEGYSNFSKNQIKNLVKFAEQVLADCASYVQIKKTERSPRKKKPVTPEKLTQKFKHLREFDELKLKSEPVTKLVGATEAWFYDTKKRKLIHVVADPHINSLTVKGAAVMGYDATNSIQKTLRKPQEQLKAFMTGGAPAARKYFKDIKATETKYNGRSNENLILLRIR